MSGVEPPAIVLRGAVGADVLRQVCAGAEEEGVPVAVEQAEGDPVALAHAAALASPLEVGIGVGRDGAVAVHHASLRADRPVERIAPENARRAGRTAARIVKILPLD
ncbi:glycerol dehydratase reactivase beta/small subunit family protein [Pseudonocardia xishanensis]|uniref:glycerol dehydratase reactivase beta/small subunit family protein n=1 Tax=Pseudonocardia xishanensis TaxID=630995 RepID=UPI0031F03546